MVGASLQTAEGETACELIDLGASNRNGGSENREKLFVWVLVTWTYKYIGLGQVKKSWLNEAVFFAARHREERIARRDRENALHGCLQSYNSPPQLTFNNIRWMGWVLSRYLIRYCGGIAHEGGVEVLSNQIQSTSGLHVHIHEEPKRYTDERLPGILRINGEIVRRHYLMILYTSERAPLSDQCIIVQPLSHVGTYCVGDTR